MLHSLSITLLLLAACTEGVLAAEDIDETVAIIIFSILIVVFLGLAGLFVVLIIRLKRRRDRGSFSRDQYDGPQPSKKQRDIVRLNSDHGLKGFHQRHEPELPPVYEEKPSNGISSHFETFTGVIEHQVSTDPLLSSATTTSSTVFVNPGYSADLDDISEAATTTTTVAIATTTTQQEETKSEKAQPQLESSDSNDVNPTSDVTNNDTHLNENTGNTLEKEHQDDSVEPEKNIIVTFYSKNDDPMSSLVGDDPTDKGVVFQNPSVAQPIDNSPLPLPATNKKKEFLNKPLFRKAERRDSTKPLLTSQSSTPSTTDESPPGSTSALPETFDEKEEQNTDL